MEKFETHTFKVSDDSRLFILEPMDMGGDQIKPKFCAKWNDGKGRASSVQQPLIVWGESINDRMPYEWFDMIERAKRWKLPTRPIFNGCTVTIRVGLYDYSTPVMRETITGRTLVAVHVHDNEPTNQALAWLQEQIADRKGWFNG